MRKLALLASVIILTPLGLAAAVKSLTPDMPASAAPGAQRFPLMKYTVR